MESSGPSSSWLGFERAERREEDVLRLRWLESASISSMAAKSGDTERSAGVGARECGGVGKVVAEGLKGGIMALSVGAGGAGVGADVSSNVAAGIRSEAGGTPFSLSARSVGSSRGVS
jgi:hypothetical protein